ncbi:hypothetical protein MG5_05564 [Candida albicans P57072]|uniref:VPS9 domain-containing protein n=1 Tax=Candida albicans (strain WO-1) TaxID=294748 RepID=C4YL59_CANAW|nr:conserved hypothetical protein [Candida albicans WO-1]KGR01707.1 hypothetical protein MG5_05564 [Candida albicans P57072]KHC29602.1 Hap43p-repressed protein [Candida albicans P76055]KHC30032.1 Hap43p-repressed protein [Candida albicans P76067]KHC44995.1 Hap43p-repressed protein [Candida albicans P60002]
MDPPYPLLSKLEEDVKTNLILHPQISSFIQLFLRYLKEPRYQAPLTITELSTLFKKFYQDLNVLTICIFTQSNSTKKQLISHCDYFNENPKVFDYLLAIANYSTSSIRLLKRSDNDALYQLRVFNYYKLLTIFESIHLAELELFQSVSLGDDICLYDKIFRFDQKDTIYQEFLQEKLNCLRQLNLSFKHFIDQDLGNQDKLVNIIDNLTQEDLISLQEDLTSLNTEITPYAKLKKIVSLHKNLIKLFSQKGFENKEINNDLLLPALIYLLVYKLETNDLYLSFLFIRNFLNLIDSSPIELYQINLYLSYNPAQERTPLSSSKYKKSDILGYLNLQDSQDLPQEQSHILSDEFKFFTNDKELISYINQKFLNTGELNYYLTNFEAMIVYLSNMTIAELLSNSETEISSDLRNSSILKHPIDKLVDEELLTHFQFPDGELANEMKATENKVREDEAGRSRSSSLLNTISNKINETRSRSSSLRKEKFPSLPTPTEELEENSGFAMMRNILGRFSSASGATEGVYDEENNDSPQSNLKKTNSFISKVSPIHSRTRSSSLENATATPGHYKRNSITAKFTSGVSEFMTKLNQPAIPSNLHPDNSVSNVSLQSIEDGDSDATMSRRPTAGRNRTTSIQILDKWFGNLSPSQTNSQPLTVQQQEAIPASTMPSVQPPIPPKAKPEVLSEELIVDIEQLTKFHNSDFESLSIQDLRELKNYYDQLCQDLLSNGNHESNGKIYVNSRTNSIDKVGSHANSLDKFIGKEAPEAGDLNSKAESVESSDRFGTATIITSSNNSL